MNRNHSTIVIIGGGIVGMAQAIALAEKDVDVTVIDHEDPTNILKSEFDGRVSAIAWRSKKLLEKIGVWEEILPHAEPILDIRVSEFGSNLFLHFDHNEIGDEPFGYIIENRFTRMALHERAKQLPKLKLIAPAKVESIDYRGQCIEYKDPHYGLCSVTYGLLIGADGKNSKTREAAGIEVSKRLYNQTGIVCTIEHEKPHQGLAHEHFLTVGPFAVLPMQGNRSSLVWCEPSDIAHIYLKMTDEELIAQIRKRVQHLGTIKLASQRWGYRLELVHAEKYTAQNVALIGDAAHSIHPIAGQGVNLGFRDVELLTKIILERLKLGLLPGSMLDDYEALRKLDNSIMIAATDGLNRLFTNNILPLKLARQAGLGLVNQIPPLKRAFMKYASGKLKA